MQELMQSAGEQTRVRLCSLYNRYGYAQYKMNQFEEYDLYARNKDFLVSDSVITFTDTNGHLMALKPDVTLSIVKNSRPEEGGVRKVFYNENVYRVSDDAHAFREIPQVGLECLGEVDDYQLCEVIRLAALSLRTISEGCVLDLSHLGLLSALLDTLGLTACKDRVLHLLGEKNPHELRALCREAGAPDETGALLCRVAALGGSPAEVLPEVTDLFAGRVSETLFAHFLRVISSLGPALSEMVRIDFSVVDDLHYYNGFVFKGFVPGLPQSVLSGGQYDNLMQRMGKCGQAVGFAVYTDRLERPNGTENGFDIDAVLLYDDTTSPDVIGACVASLIDDGIAVCARRSLPPGLRCRRVYQIREGEVTLLEEYA